MPRVRICPICAATNEAIALICSACGRPEVAEVPEVETAEEDCSGKESRDETRRALDHTSDSIILELLENSDIKFEVKSGDTVGRKPKDPAASAPDVVLLNVPNELYISRRMALFTRRGKQWFVEHVGQSNHLMVDGQEVAELGVQIPIEDGTTIAMPMTVFVVRIEGEP